MGKRDLDKKYLDIKKEQVAIYQALFNTKDGKFVLEDLRKAFGDRPSFVVGDAYQTAYNEGQRDIYLRIKRILGMDLGKLIERSKKTND